MIVTIQYGNPKNKEITDPLDGVTRIEREVNALYITYSDGTRSRFINGHVVEVWDNADTVAEHDTE